MTKPGGKEEYCREKLFINTGIPVNEIPLKPIMPRDDPELP